MEALHAERAADEDVVRALAAAHLLARVLERHVDIEPDAVRGGGRQAVERDERPAIGLLPRHAVGDPQRLDRHGKGDHGEVRQEDEIEMPLAHRLRLRGGARGPCPVPLLAMSQLEHLGHRKNASAFRGQCQVARDDCRRGNSARQAAGRAAREGSAMSAKVKSDIEIARAAKKRPILEIGSQARHSGGEPRALRQRQGEGLGRFHRLARRPAGRQADPRHRHQPDAGGRGQDHDDGRPRRRAEPHRQDAPRSACASLRSAPASA